MLTNDPQPIHLKADAPIFDKVRMLLGHYDLRAYVTDTAYVDLGRGSFDAVFAVEARVEDFAGCLGTVGQFCNFAQPCHIQAGGEHHHELPVHTVFSNVPALGSLARGIPSLRTKPPRPFQIGNAVVMSSRSTVLDGASVGDGCLLGANCLVTGSVEPFSIAVGQPARALRRRQHAERLAAVRWWDFDLLYLANNVQNLQELAIDTSVAHVYRKPTPRLALRVSNKGVNVMGVVGNDVQVPEKAQAYIAQLGGPGPYYWLADMWN